MTMNSTGRPTSIAANGGSGTDVTVSGSKGLLQAEGLALFAASLVAFHTLGTSWWMYAALFFLPDVSFLGYLAGSRFGAWGYNILHSTIGPMLLAGSAYMIWIGYTLARSSIVISSVDAPRPGASRKIFFQALLTCLLNPKAWLFTFAIVPQFMKPAFGPLWSQGLVMGLMTISVQGIVYGGLALAALRSRDAIVSTPALTIWIGRGAGVFLMVIAAYTAVQGWAGV